MSNIPTRYQRSPHPVLGNQRGILPIFAIALFLAIIVGILIVVVTGLDDVYQGQTGRSMFPEEAKIHEIRDKINDAKDEVHALIAEHSSAEDEAKKTAPEQPTAVAQTPTERLENVERRLEMDKTGEDSE